MLHHIERGAVPACKVLLHVLIHEIRVEGRDRVVPWFRVPGGADLNVRALAGWAPPAGFEPAHPAPEAGALSPELRGRFRPGLATLRQSKRLSAFGTMGG